MDTGHSIDFKPSRQLLLAYMVLAAVSILGVANLPIALIWQSLLMLFVLGLIAWVIYKTVLLKAHGSIVQLAFYPHLPIGQQWQLQTKGGNKIKATLVLQDCFVSSYLTVLNLKPISTNRAWYHLSESIVILPDAVDAEQYRRLRVLLKWVEHELADNPVQ